MPLTAPAIRYAALEAAFQPWTKYVDADERKAGPDVRAVQFEQFGGPEVLNIVEVDEPHAGPGEVRVGAMPTLVAIVGDASSIIAISDLEGAQESGVRASGGPGDPRRWEALGAAAELVRRGELGVPVQQVFPLEDVAEAERISQSGHVTGELILSIDRGED